jgi:hypothetical protein
MTKFVLFGCGFACGYGLGDGTGFCAGGSTGQASWESIGNCSLCGDSLLGQLVLPTAIETLSGYGDPSGFGEGKGIASDCSV